MDNNLINLNKFDQNRLYVLYHFSTYMHLKRQYNLIIKIVTHYLVLHSKKLYELTNVNGVYYERNF